MNKKIGVIGLWHLGSVISASWAKLGHNIYCFDYDKKRIEDFENGKMPIYEPGLEETINKSRSENRMIFSNGMDILSDCDFIFLSYDTPVKEDDSSDTAILEKSILDVSKIIKSNAIVIISSQSPVGYCRLLRNILQKNNKSCELAYSPENLRLGEAINCYLNPERIILGTDNKETEKKCMDLFSELKSEVICIGLESSEMVKHGINSFLSMSIVYTNSLSDICEETGADIKDVVRGLKSDPRIGEKAYLSPGIGFSGGTLGRDLVVLGNINKKLNGSGDLFEFIYKSNFNRKISIVNKIKKITGELYDKTIGILGLTYKPGTSTLRRSLPLEIVELLLCEKAKVKVYDPKADFSELKQKPEYIICENINETAKDSDILVVLTDWPEFKVFDWQAISGSMKSPNFFDARNYIPRENVEKANLNYYSIGDANAFKR